MVDGAIVISTHDELASRKNLDLRAYKVADLLKTLATDLPYVPLYIQDYNVALSGKFTWPNYNVYTQWGAWALNIKPKN